MAERMTFPMYAIHRQQTQALWLAVQSLLAERGVMVTGDPPAADPEDLQAHWRQPGLLLSQTCGYPLVTQLPEVQTVGCFHYAAPGCEGRRYRSLLVVREADSHRMLADFFGRRAVCNAEHSQSGYNVLRKMVAPLSRQGRFFSAVVFSGSHRQSLRELQQENADIAAIDCVTYALLQRHQPQALA
ncbi:phosphate/phosphite/phosphonate ABC transporter substrate-binding protein, partial [Klebsiella pneumoniae]|uniref:phosphate/phosphite/phosphonate ABC transporter substrate-binding protein n=3 Tax=Klebsiella/Raoultella group TaxID=2890311 RepID=UPI0039C0ECB9